MLLGRQVNTLFCLIAAKRKKRETETREKEEGDEKNGVKKRRRRRLQTLGELWLQAFVSNLKTKSSGNIKTSFKNNKHILWGSIWHSITLDMYTIPKNSLATLLHL